MVTPAEIERAHAEALVMNFWRDHAAKLVRLVRAHESAWAGANLN